MIQKYKWVLVILLCMSTLQASEARVSVKTVDPIAILAEHVFPEIANLSLATDDDLCSQAFEKLQDDSELLCQVFPDLAEQYDALEALRNEGFDIASYDKIASAQSAFSSALASKLIEICELLRIQLVQLAQD